jgi:hypothetical protein
MAPKKSESSVVVAATESNGNVSAKDFVIAYLAAHKAGEGMKGVVARTGLKKTTCIGRRQSLVKQGFKFPRFPRGTGKNGMTEEEKQEIAHLLAEYEG